MEEKSEHSVTKKGGITRITASATVLFLKQWRGFFHANFDRSSWGGKTESSGVCKRNFS